MPVRADRLLSLFSSVVATWRGASARQLGALTIILLLSLVVTRIVLLRRRGIRALYFGSIDKTDFFIPPFAFFYFYLVFAAAFGLPTVSRQQFFASETVTGIGVLFCATGLLLLVLSLASFGKSFRVGIDPDHADALVTTGVFAFSRNPIYAGFACVLVGEFLIFPNWILLAYAIAGTWLLHRQTLREEEYLRRHYGREYVEYSRRVRRYL
jgi:protein-S-isoprenylcysteine O-methyltransferase Ste14